MKIYLVIGIYSNQLKLSENRSSKFNTYITQVPEYYIYIYPKRSEDGPYFYTID